MAVNIGLGCVTFGREIDSAASFALMDHAGAMGIRSFDTASVYGSGASETIIGEWMARRGLNKREIVIATKILPPYNPSHIRKSVEESLKRLGVETIDLLYLHRWDEDVNSPEAWLTLDSLCREGKIKAIGASNFNTDQLAGAVNLLKEIGGIKLSYIQNNHNLAVSDISAGMKEICLENAIRMVTYSPLGAGFLTGKHLHGVQKNSRFEIVPGHQGIYFNANAQKRLSKLLEVAERTGYAPAFLALAWATHQPNIYEVLVGGRSVAQIDLVAKAKEFNAPDLFAELENV